MRVRQLFLETRPLEPSGIPVFHGTISGDVGEKFKTGTHFGSLAAAHQRINDLTGLPGPARGYFQPGDGDEAPAVYPARLRPNRVLDLPDFGEWWPDDVIAELSKRNIIGQSHLEWLAQHDGDWMELLRHLGYDAVRYPNQHEDSGSYSYIVLDPAIIHSY